MNEIKPQGLSLDSVQAMRAIAAMSVVLAHIPFISVGVFGVDIFFVISGFIVAYVTSAGADGFFRKRISRIVPLYWAGTLGVFSIALFAPHLLESTTADPANLLKSMLFIPYLRENGTVTPMLPLGWTLNYEIFFYLLYALILRISHQYAPMLAIAALVAVVSAGRAIHADNIIWQFFTEPVLLEFAYGLTAYTLWKDRHAFFSRLPIPAIAIVILGSLTILIMYGDTSISNEVRWWVLGLPAFIFFVSMLSLQGRIRMPALLVLTGDASYSLYLFHMYVIQLVNRKIIALSTLNPMTAIIALATIALCVFLALMCFRWFERPSNQWLRRRLT